LTILLLTRPQKLIRTIKDIRLNQLKSATITRNSFNVGRKIEPNKAYIAGLMLDIGLVLRFVITIVNLKIFHPEIIPRINPFIASTKNYLK
jgi:hypothetical protein